MTSGLTTLLLSPRKPRCSEAGQGQFTALLGVSEQQRYTSLRGRRQSEYLLSRVLLREGLSLHFPEIAPRQWQVVERVDLPPLVIDAVAIDTFFSIAHSKGRAAVVVSQVAPVGVDIEQCRAREFLAFSRHWFSDRETRELEDCSDEIRQERFYQMWTLKEAYVKLHGGTLFDGTMQTLRAIAAPRSSRGKSPPASKPGRDLGLHMQIADHSLALVMGSPVELECHDFRLYEGLPPRLRRAELPEISCFDLEKTA